MDTMYLYGKPVLHIFDAGIRFSAARFLPDVSTNTVCKSILDHWETIYTGLPNHMLVYHGMFFRQKVDGGFFIQLSSFFDFIIEKTII